MKNSIKLNPTTALIMNYVSVNVRPICLTNVNEIVILFGFDESEKVYVVSVLNVKNSHVEHLFYDGRYKARQIYEDYVRVLRVMKH